MSPKSKLVLAIVALAAAFSAGRYSLPEKIRVETKTMAVEKKTTDTKSDLDLNKHKEMTTVTTRKPDGTVETTTKVTEDTNANRTTDQKTADSITSASDTTKEVTYAASKVTISMLAGSSFQTPEIIYGISLSRPILGPVTLGAWALTDRTVGFSLGLSF